MTTVERASGTKAAYLDEREQPGRPRHLVQGHQRPTGHYLQYGPDVNLLTPRASTAAPCGPTPGAATQRRWADCSGPISPDQQRNSQPPTEITPIVVIGCAPCILPPQRDDGLDEGCDESMIWFVLL